MDKQKIVVNNSQFSRDFIFYSPQFLPHFFSFRCSKYTVVRELDLELQGVYNNVASRLDKALFDICRNFTPENYEGLVSDEI